MMIQQEFPLLALRTSLHTFDFASIKSLVRSNAVAVGFNLTRRSLLLRIVALLKYILKINLLVTTAGAISITAAIAISTASAATSLA